MNPPFLLRSDAQTTVEHSLTQQIFERQIHDFYRKTLALSGRTSVIDSLAGLLHACMMRKLVPPLDIPPADWEATPATIANTYLLRGN
jgi:hypothetical protein